MTASSSPELGAKDQELTSVLVTANPPFTLAVANAARNSIPEIKARALAEVTGPVDYVDGCNDQATILCLDEFRPAPGSPPESTPHGEYVVSVLRSAGLQESQIQKVHQASASDARNDLFEEGPESPKERLQAFIELTALEDLESTRHAIAETTTRPGNRITTITNSIGSTPVRVASGIFAASVIQEEGKPSEISEVGELVFDALGVPAEATSENVALVKSRLLSDAVDIVDNSPAFRSGLASFERELEALQDRGVAYFLSAGNDQKRVENLREEGFTVSPRAAYISKTVPSAELVAALDTKGTADPQDDQVAEFSSQHPWVSYAAKGVEVQVEGRQGPQTLKGSSLSAPWVAAKRELFLEAHPEVTADELEDQFRQTSPRMLTGGIAIIAG